MAHPDKNPVRNAYHCAIAGVVMDAIQRAYDMVASSSFSDRDAFHLLPALDSAQFEAAVDAHRLAKAGRTPTPVRSPTTPVARGSATPIHAGGHPLAVPHIPALPLPGFADPLSPEPRMFSTTDPPPPTPTALPNRSGIHVSRTSRMTAMAQALPSSPMTHTPPQRSRRLIARA